MLEGLGRSIRDSLEMIGTENDATDGPTRPQAGRRLTQASSSSR
jgi:hypothetical protein